MKYRGKVIWLAVMGVGVLIIAVWLSTAVLWPSIFANSRPVVIEQNSTLPLQVAASRDYLSYTFPRKIASVLKIELRNTSSKDIHSFWIRYHSAAQADMGSGVWQPPATIIPGKTEPIWLRVNGKDTLTLSVEFVQYADGTIWLPPGSQDSESQVSLKAGAEAAQKYLLSVLENAGPEQVLEKVPYIHTAVQSEQYTPATNDFGFYCGVSSIAVLVQHAHQEGGLPRVEQVLQNYEVNKWILLQNRRLTEWYRSFLDSKELDLALAAARTTLDTRCKDQVDLPRQLFPRVQCRLARNSHPVLHC